MLDDLTKEIKAQLYDRARSPLFAAFAFSWVAWNFRSIIILFSTMKVEEKLAYWSLLYPVMEDWLLRAVVFPLGTSILFLLVYPIPARWAFHYWHWQHSKLKAVQQKIEDQTPITQEEANEIRRSFLEQQTKTLEQLRVANVRNQELTDQREELLAQVAKLHEEIGLLRSVRDDAEKRVGELQEELKRVVESEKSIAEADKRKGAKEGPASEATDLDGPNKTMEIVERMRSERELSELAGKIILYLCVSGGEANISDLQRLTGSGRIELDVALGQLERRKLIGKNATRALMTDQLKEYVVDIGLMKALSPQKK